VTEDVHFVQGGEGTALVGAGDGVLACACGRVLIEGFSTSQFLSVGVRCGGCGAVTTTAPLPEGKMPPPGLSAAEVSSEPRVRPMQVPAGVAVVGRAEMERLGSLLRPRIPDPTYQMTATLLDNAEAAFALHAGGALPMVASDESDAFAGMREHALAWAVRHLWGRVGEPDFRCMETAATSAAVSHVAAFLHFVATWSQHPLFPVMMATAGDRGFSLHGLALFAAAHSLAMMRNRTGFRDPIEFPARIEGFDLAVGATETVRVHLSVFDRFEFPYGRKWDPVGLRAAVEEVVAGAQGRINRRNPGVLLVSPGVALLGFDEALIAAVKDVMASEGRKNRGLMAVAPIVLRVQPLPDPHTVRFGYGLFPTANRHYAGAGMIETGGQRR
jgi:hypothetical protein